MEKLFKFLFAFGVFVFALVAVGIFLLIVKVILLFQPELHFMGVLMSFVH